MAELLTSLWVPLLGLAALPAVLAAARRVRLDGPESLALAWVLALVWCMAGGILLGAFGVLNAAAVWGWLAAGAVASLAAGLRAGLSTRVWLASWSGWSGIALLAPPLLLLLLLAAVPPWYRDSLVYHLALPRHFAQHAATVWPDDNIFAAFPMGWHAALALLHATGAAPDHDPSFNPRLVGAWTLFGAALATAVLARAAGAARPLAATAGALLLLLPTAVEFGASAYVESALLLLVTTAFWAALRADAAPGRGHGWLASAVFVGLACWIKYPALAALAFLAIAVPLIENRRRGAADAVSFVKRATQWLACAAVVGCPFFVRNALNRGNPFFPTSYGVFGGEGWDEWRAWAYGVTLDHYGNGRDLVDYLLLPWRLFTQRGLDAGFEGSLGPLVALGAPLGVWLLWRAAPGPLRRAAGLLLGWVCWMSLAWAFTIQQTRFYLVATPALLALVAAGLSAALARRASPRRESSLHSGLPLRRYWVAAAAAIAIQLIWSAGPVSALWQRQATGDWLAGRLDRDALLARMLPETYRATRELERFVPEDGRVWLVWMRGYTYYLRRPYRLDCVFEAWRLEELLDRSENASAIGDSLRRDGITHLLVNHRFFLRGDNADLRPGRTELLRRRFARAIDRGEISAVESWGRIALYAVADQRTPRVAVRAGAEGRARPGSAR